MYQVSSDSATPKKQEKTDKANIEIDSSETADLYSVLGFENDEKPSERFVLAEDNSSSD